VAPVPALPAPPAPDPTKGAEVVVLKRSLELRTRTPPDLFSKAAHV
jgi:hypothetical protein